MIQLIPVLSVRRLRAVVVILATAADVSTCRLDELLTSPDLGALSLSPIQLTDSAAVGSIPPRVWTVELSKTGTTPLSWTARRARGSS